MLQRTHIILGMTADDAILIALVYACLEGLSVRDH